MTTSNDAPAPSTAARVPLRLTLTPDDGRAGLDGAWWPQGRDLVTEVADLVDHFPPERARISRVLYSPPDWDGPRRRIPVVGREVRAGAFPGDDTHVVVLRTSDRTTLTLLVVPPAFEPAQGEEAMLAATTVGHRHSPAEILAEVTEHATSPSRDHWSDDGGTWWPDGTAAPSYR